MRFRAAIIFFVKNNDLSAPKKMEAARKQRILEAWAKQTRLRTQQRAYNILMP
jgi:hypothetical protein